MISVLWYDYLPFVYSPGALAWQVNKIRNKLILFRISLNSTYIYIYHIISKVPRNPTCANFRIQDGRKDDCRIKFYAIKVISQELEVVET